MSPSALFHIPLPFAAPAERAREGTIVADDNRSDVRRDILPIPDVQHIGLTTYDAKDPDTSYPPIRDVRPPATAPNVVVILIDDVGFGASSAFGGPCETPNFEKLAAGGMNASALREGMEISQPAMSQHLSVLRSAKLVREERQGRFVNYEVDPDGLALIAQWLAKYRAYWPARIEALKVLLKDMDQ
jgi:hypothetical protein